MIRRVALASCLALGCEGAPSPEAREANACVPDASGRAWTFEDAIEQGPFVPLDFERTFVDSSRTTPAVGDDPGAPERTLKTRIWYPATVENAPAKSDGPFPIVVYSHGFSSGNAENQALFKLLASHGYLVVSTRYPASAIDAPGGPTTLDIAQQPLDARFVLDQVLALSRSDDAILDGLADESRIAAAGLSMGGLTSLLLTFHAGLRDPRIDLVIAMAPRSSAMLPAFYETTNVPALVLFGTSDAILPYVDHAGAYRDRTRAPRSLLTLVDGTHTGFSGISALFPADEHPDSIACGVIAGVPGDAGYDSELLLGAENGIENPSSATPSCEGDLGQYMSTRRQLAIESAAVRAQLDAYFAEDSNTRGRACHFVERVLPREVDVELDRR